MTSVSVSEVNFNPLAINSALKRWSGVGLELGQSKRGTNSPKLVTVVDGTVVDQSNTVFGISVRMSILISLAAMSCPSCVADSSEVTGMRRDAFPEEKRQRTDIEEKNETKEREREREREGGREGGREREKDLTEGDQWNRQWISWRHIW
jgi:hypothetical protein